MEGRRELVALDGSTPVAGLSANVEWEGGIMMVDSGRFLDLEAFP